MLIETKHKYTVTFILQKLRIQLKYNYNNTYKINYALGGKIKDNFVY